MSGVFDTKRAGVRYCALTLLMGACFAPGCGSDDRFSAETSDEYTSQLTDALVGSPEGLTTIGPDGVSTTVANAKGSAGAGGAAGGPVATGGAGGSFGTAGSAPIGGTGNVGNSGGSSGEGGTGQDSGGGFGFWHFDDCSPSSHFLADSSGNGANAQQALKAKCVPGISGLGVQFANVKDVVQVPDEPQFTVGQHLGVAAWVNPSTVGGDQPIVLKRLNDKTSFSLGIHKGNIQMSVVLSTGKTIISQAPIAANTWTHVAGLYDGTFLFLFINGQQFGQVFAAGTIRDVFAPIRIGATTDTQHFSGVIDDVFVSTQVLRATDLTALSCITNPSTVSVSPATSGPVPFDTTVHYDLSVKDNDVGLCGPKSYETFLNTDPGITALFGGQGQFQTGNPGQTLDFGVDVTGSEDADPGVHTLPFVVDVFGNQKSGFEQLNGQLTYELTQPTGCFVTTKRELMITSTSVVDDPVRTAGSSNGNPGGGGTGGKGGGAAGGSFGVGGSGQIGSAGVFGKDEVFGEAGSPDGAGGSGGTGDAPTTAGVWSFGYLMRQMAPTPEQAPAMVLQLLQHWLSDQSVNGFTVSARPAMQQQLIDIWPKTADGQLDLDQSPLTLQAIVNRIDVRNLAEGSAGEGRFVFGVNGGSNFQQFTLILEYNLPAKTQADVLTWANRWHALASHPFPSEEYNAALEAVTRSFTDRGSDPTKPNGNALVELRTNEIALSFQWELRAFELSPTTGLFDETTVKETPDLSFNNTPAFSDFVNQNADAIIAEVPGANAHTVPNVFEGRSFMGGSVFNNLVQWNGPGIANPDARFHASLNTCNGCHGPETNTGFLMVTPRLPGQEAFLSGFLTGTTVFDQFSGQTRTLNDLARRRTDLTSLVCAPAATPSTSATTTPAKKKNK